MEENGDAVPDFLSCYRPVAAASDVDVPGFDEFSSEGPSGAAQ